MRDPRGRTRRRGEALPVPRSFVTPPNLSLSPLLENICDIKDTESLHPSSSYPTPLNFYPPSPTNPKHINQHHGRHPQDSNRRRFREAQRTPHRSPRPPRYPAKGLEARRGVGPCRLHWSLRESILLPPPWNRCVPAADVESFKSTLIFTPSRETGRRLPSECSSFRCRPRPPLIPCFADCLSSEDTKVR